MTYSTFNDFIGLSDINSDLMHVKSIPDFSLYNQYTENNE